MKPTSSTRAMDDDLDLRPRDRLSTTPLWVFSGQAALVVAVVYGFGSFVGPHPRLTIAVLVAATAAMVVLGPVGRARRLVVSVPAVAYLTWWALSFMWTENRWLYERETFNNVTLVVCLTLVATMLPLEDVKRGLVASCYVALVSTVVYTGLNPGDAMHHSDGTPGWHGGFGHKNLMGPFMLFAIATLVTIGRRSPARWLGIGVAAFFVLSSQSTTSMVVAAALCVHWVFLQRLASAPTDRRNGLIAVASFLGIAIVLTGAVYLPTLTSMLGKDPTLTARTEIWEGVVWAIGERPLTGYGAGGAWINVADDPARTIIQDLGFVVTHAHNGLLEVAFQLGLVGLALLIALFVAFMGASVRLLSIDADLATYFLMFAGLLTLTSITETTTFGIWLALLCTFHALALRVMLDANPQQP